MSIPKVIHYCWFGRNPLPESALKCIKSWKKKCSHYRIVEWNEDNFDVSVNLYCRQAYENKKWAFVTDFARLWILYNYGGLYFDTDVKVIKSFDDMLDNQCFLGIEKSTRNIQVNTGVGMGCEKGNPVVKALMDSYADIPFIIDGKQDITTCTVRNTAVLEKFGYKNEDVLQKLDSVTVYPSEFFSPMEMESGMIRKTKNTHSIHLYSLSWTSKENQERRKRYLKELKRKNLIYNIKILPNRVMKKAMGEEKYFHIKERVKRKL